MNKLERMDFLVEEILKHNRNYYENDNPSISDAEYDELYYELVDLEKELNMVYENSPTKKVGGEVLSGFKKREHEVRLYSLNKVRDREQLEKWVSDVRQFDKETDFSLEYKFDGVQLVVVYENGCFQRATTRGNGEVGEDVTEQIRCIKSIPFNIPHKEKIIVQGEGMMTLSAFNKYNKTAKEPLKSPRNAAAGAIRNLDLNETRKRNLDFFCYSVLKSEKTFATQKQMNSFLKDQGFLTGDYFYICKSVDEIEEQIKKVDKEKEFLDIMIDGMVLKVDNTSMREEMGYTNKFPKWALAFKFEAEEMTTVLKDVVWQVGRTGKVSPLAIVEPVFLAGATVQRATLNNFEDIQRKNLSINSRVFIRRSNEVIPEVLGLAEKFENSVEIKSPERCPSCNFLLQRKGPLLFCTNFHGCKEQVVNRLCHFSSRDAMNIEGLSKKTIEDFVEVLGLKNFSDIYDITYENLISLEKVKDKKANNILNSINKSKKVSFSKFIYALGINEVGVKTARDLAKTFSSVEDLKKASIEDLNNIKDVGEIIANNIGEYFDNVLNIQQIEKLFEKGVEIVYDKIEKVDSELTGLKVVVTGTLSLFDRKEAQEQLLRLGAEVISSISSKTDILIVGENAGSKLKKAQELGVKTINEDEFSKIVEKNLRN